MRPGRAELRATAEGLKRLAALGAYAAEAVRAADPPDRRGWSRLALPIETIEQAALLLLGIGPEVAAIAPDALRARLSALAARWGGSRAGPLGALHPLILRSR